MNEENDGEESAEEVVGEGMAFAGKVNCLRGWVGMWMWVRNTSWILSCVFGRWWFEMVTIDMLREMVEAVSWGVSIHFPSESSPSRVVVSWS